jgi:small neutral amino acid transporter SnatA (MarC family)
LIALVVVACNAILSFLILSSSDSLRKILRTNGTNALSGITAPLIAALAVSFVATGVTDIMTALR